MALFVSKADRDRNLDALATSAQEWFDKEIARLDNETKFLRSVLQGRGAALAGTSNLIEASKKVQSEINAFLGGGL